MSEREYLDYVKEHPDAAKRAGQESLPPFELILADGSVYPHKGIFSFADRQVDVKTGTLRLQGVFPNPGNVLRPGQYARIRAITKTAKGALLVPQRAVTEQQGNYQLAVVGSDNKVEIRPVKVGERVGTQWIIEERAKAGRESCRRRNSEGAPRRDRQPEAGQSNGPSQTRTHGKVRIEVNRYV